jgi:hypothetical protein
MKRTTNPEKAKNDQKFPAADLAALTANEFGHPVMKGSVNGTSATDL